MEVKPFCAPYLPNLSGNGVFPSLGEDEAAESDAMPRLELFEVYGCERPPVQLGWWPGFAWIGAGIAAYGAIYFGFTM